MDLVKVLLAAAVFVAFVPGVLFHLPKGGSKWTVLALHAVLFAGTLYLVMKWYRSVEGFGNFGPCPPGYRDGVSDTGVDTCVPEGNGASMPE
jgi:hypothetical protein